MTTTNVADDDAARLAALIGDSDSADSAAEDAEPPPRDARHRARRPRRTARSARRAHSSWRALPRPANGRRSPRSRPRPSSASSPWPRTCAASTNQIGRGDGVRDGPRRERGRRARKSPLRAQASLARARSSRAILCGNRPAPHGRDRVGSMAAAQHRQARDADGGDAAAERDEAQTWTGAPEGWAYERNQRLARLEAACDEARRAPGGSPTETATACAPRRRRRRGVPRAPRGRGLRGVPARGPTCGVHAALTAAAMA